MRRTLTVIALCLSLPACEVAVEPPAPAPSPIIDCSAVACIDGMLHGVDCPAVETSCGADCDGYLACSAACSTASDPANCRWECSHRSYNDDAGRLQRSTAGVQFLACACCQ